MKMENESQNFKFTDDKIEKLKTYLSLFNTLILIDDIILHISEIKYIFYYTQLMIGEILILYLWLSLRQLNIKLDKNLICYCTISYSLISIVYFIYQLSNGTFEGNFMYKTLLFHQIVNSVSPIILILFIIYFTKNKSYSSIEVDINSNLMDL